MQPDMLGRDTVSLRLEPRFFRSALGLVIRIRTAGRIGSPGGSPNLDLVTAYALNSLEMLASSVSD